MKDLKDYCRNCLDNKDWHRDCGQECGRCFSCNFCDEFIPSDNLEYLEYKEEFDKE